VFLGHVRSALVALLVLPIGLLVSILVMNAARHQRQHHVDRRSRAGDRRDGRQRRRA
jgi:ABC-type transport system involved in cytochrome bd biosynthesis fused ATPase/permease subunit